MLLLLMMIMIAETTDPSSAARLRVEGNGQHDRATLIMTAAPACWSCSAAAGAVQVQQRVAKGSLSIRPVADMWAVLDHLLIPPAGQNRGREEEEEHGCDGGRAKVIRGWSSMIERSCVGSASAASSTTSAKAEVVSLAHGCCWRLQGTSGPRRAGSLAEARGRHGC